MTGELRYRLATPADAPRIARLHVDNWRRTYRGILTDSWLDDGIEADRAERWRTWAGGAHPPAGTVTVVREAGDELAGFVHAVADEDAELGGLIDNLHVQEHRRRQGIAGRLMGEAGRWLNGHAEVPGAYLYVLAANTSAQRFYDAVGGRAVARSLWEAPDGTAVPDITYHWATADSLAALLPPGTPPLA